MIEIERKFLVKPFQTTVINSFAMNTIRKLEIWQGYFAKGEKCSIRLRVVDGKPIITFKAATAGMSRQEFEFGDKQSLPLRGMDIEHLQDMCENSLCKTRHVYQHWNGEQREVWEIDVFHGPLEGLILAEIELPSEDYEFDRPPWLGEEVTHRGEYYNYSLAKNQSYPGQEFFHDKTKDE